jgi:hypothetical protein
VEDLEEEDEDVPPLPYQQLTWLQFRFRCPKPTRLLAMIAQLPQLEILDMLYAKLEFSQADAVKSIQLPKLRLVKLTGAQPWVPERKISRTDPQYLPTQAVQHRCGCSGQPHTLSGCWSHRG